MPVTYEPGEAARALIAAVVVGDFAEATRLVDDIVSSPRSAIEACLACLALSAAQGVSSSAEIRSMPVDDYLAELFAGCAARAEAAG